MVAWTSAGFLSLGTIDILGQIILTVWGYPEHCRTLNSIPGLYTLDASDTASSNCNNLKCHQALLNVPLGTQLPWERRREEIGICQYQSVFLIAHRLKNGTSGKWKVHSLLQFSMFHTKPFWPSEVPPHHTPTPSLSGSTGQSIFYLPTSEIFDFVFTSNQKSNAIHPLFYVDPLLLPGCGLCLLNLFSPTNPQSLERWPFPSLLMLCPKNLVQLDSSSSGLSQHVLLFWLFWHLITWDSFL